MAQRRFATLPLSDHCPSGTTAGAEDRPLLASPMQGALADMRAAYACARPPSRPRTEAGRRRTHATLRLACVASGRDRASRPVPQHEAANPAATGSQQQLPLSLAGLGGAIPNLPPPDLHRTAAHPLHPRGRARRQASPAADELSVAPWKAASDDAQASDGSPPHGPVHRLADATRTTLSARQEQSATRPPTSPLTRRQRPDAARAPSDDLLAGLPAPPTIHHLPALRPADPGRPRSAAPTARELVALAWQRAAAYADIASRPALAREVREFHKHAASAQVGAGSVHLRVPRGSATRGAATNCAKAGRTAPTPSAPAPSPFDGPAGATDRFAYLSAGRSALAPHKKPRPSDALLAAARAVGGAGALAAAAALPTSPQELAARRSRGSSRNFAAGSGGRA